jgi:hypothetical protein
MENAAGATRTEDGVTMARRHELEGWIVRTHRIQRTLGIAAATGDVRVRV